MRSVLTVTLLSLALPSTARDISLGLPIDCDLGTTCYIQNYVDHDPTAGRQDLFCGNLTYDGHDGTDFALPSILSQQRGVTVLAVAPGRVAALRSNMEDVLQGTPNAPDVTDRECGNGVVIDHGGGWVSQYCHLAKSSVSVSVGDQVAMGQPIGLVGLSGQTEFPHLHLSLRHDEIAVDPFSPNADTCGEVGETLWLSAPPTPVGGLISSGFAAAVPDYNTVKQGFAAAINLTPADNLVLWAFAFGAEPGDQIQLTITGPDGQTVHDHTEVLDRTQALVMRASGRRSPAAGWPSGIYTGTVQHRRGADILDQQTLAITVQ